MPNLADLHAQMFWIVTDSDDTPLYWDVATETPVLHRTREEANAERQDEADETVQRVRLMDGQYAFQRFTYSLADLRRMAGRNP